MRKRHLFTLIFILLLIFTVGCSKSKFKDGEWEAKSEIDENGYSSAINILVKDGKIDSVDYDEYDEDGGRKSEDENYSKLMEDTFGVSPSQAYEQLEGALIKTQNPDKLDAVSGATGSSEIFKNLAKEALEKAK